jgi:protein-disulfide isomerase-like protein with CxxC motif
MKILLTTVYLITQKNCVNCPAAKAVVEEALYNSEITVETIDLLKMDPDFEYRLLENQVFIASTPSILVENEGNLKMLYSGAVPSVEDVRSDLGMN